MTKLAGSSLKKNDLLTKNTLINLTGQAVPLIFAAAAIPFVIDGLGIARFGVLTIVWIIIGYFGLFDMGIGRATTKLVADLDAKGQQKLSPFILTSILLLIVLGVIGSLIIHFTTPWVVNQVLNIPPDLTGETQSAFYTLAFSIPFVLGAVGARGALEAQQQFAVVNAIRIPASIINYIAPLFVLPFTNHLQPIVMVLVIARVITFLIYAYFSLPEGFSFSLDDFPLIRWIKDLLGFGAWIMVSNFISPLMMYIDRFILGAILTMSAVAFYTTPFEMVTRLLVVSSGFMGVMFPAFSVYSLSDKKRLTRLHQQSIRYLLLVMIPITIFLILSAYPLLYWWLGNEFAANSSDVLRILAVGVLINAIAFVPYTALQAIGRPDITAKLHMVELPVYLGLIWILIHAMGIEGVALAWALRVSFDCAMLLYFSNRFISFFQGKGGIMVRNIGYAVGLVFLGAVIFSLINNLFTMFIYAVICAIITFCIVWQFVLKSAERNKIKRLMLTLRTFVNF